MLNTHRNESRPLTPALPKLCADHLRHEADVLTAAIAAVRAVAAAFGLPSAKGFTLAIGRHAEVAALLDELQQRRWQFRESAAQLLTEAPERITVRFVLNRLPAQDRAALTAELANVRRLAQDLATLNHRVSIGLRIHLDAYQRILRDLTNSNHGSGRYLPSGAAESHDYQPLIQIHG